MPERPEHRNPKAIDKEPVRESTTGNLPKPSSGSKSTPMKPGVIYQIKTDTN